MIPQYSPNITHEYQPHEIQTPKRKQQSKRTINVEATKKHELPQPIAHD